jgi:hypothetical protein
MDSFGEAEPYSTVITQLWLAVSDLVGPEDLRSRLFDAYVHNLFRLKPEDFPEELRDEFARFERSFTWLPPETRGEGTILATLRAMSDDEAERLAQKVVELLSRTLDAAYRREDL